MKIFALAIVFVLSACQSIDQYFCRFCPQIEQQGVAGNPIIAGQSGETDIGSILIENANPIDGDQGADTLNLLGVLVCGKQTAGTPAFYEVSVGHEVNAVKVNLGKAWIPACGEEFCCAHVMFEDTVGVAMRVLLPVGSSNRLTIEASATRMLSGDRVQFQFVPGGLQWEYHSYGFQGGDRDQAPWLLAEVWKN